MTLLNKFLVFAFLLSSGVMFAAPGAAGDLDLTFNQVGYSVSAFRGGFDYGLASVLQNDGKIVSAGISAYGQTTVFSAVRHNPDGSLDTSFGSGGKSLISYGGNAYGGPGIAGSNARAAAVQADGKIVLAGEVNYRVERFGQVFSDIAVVRLNADGSPDTGFDGDGKVRTFISWGINSANSLAIGSDGKIVAAGRGPGNGLVVVRYNPDGSPDTAFDGDGKLTTTAFGIADAALVQPDGKILVAGVRSAGEFLTDYYTVRLNIDGTLDTTFNGTGAAPTPAVSGWHIAHSLALQPDGKIIVAGEWDRGMIALMRYNPDGTYDNSFGNAGFMYFTYPTISYSTNKVLLQPDGKIIVAASASMTISGTENSDFILFRFGADGSVDNTFNGTGSLRTSIGAGNDYLTGVLLQPDGKIVATGHLEQTVAGMDFALVRYASNGIVDPSFGTGGSYKRRGIKRWLGQRYRGSKRQQDSGGRGDRQFCGREI